MGYHDRDIYSNLEKNKFGNADFEDTDFGKTDYANTDFDESGFEDSHYEEPDYAESEYTEADYAEDDYVETDYPESDYAESDYGEQDDFNREQNNSGTIRENLEKYRSDNVSAAKARQSSASRKKKNKEVKKRRKAAVKAARKGKKVRVVVRLTLTVLVIAICVVAFLLTYKLFYDVAIDENNKTKYEITIPEEGISHEEVAEFLYEHGCISDTRLYKYRTYIYDAKYVPGTYKVSPSYTTEKIINILSGYDYSDGTMDED